MRKISLLLIISYLLTSLIACKQDIDTFTPDPVTFDKGALVRVTVSGSIVDENNKPLEGVGVKIGNAAFSTDKYGVFSAKDIEVYQNLAYVQVSKAEYFEGSRTFVATKGKTNYVQIKMLKKTLQGTFGSGSGGKITINGVTVEFPANAIKTEDGQVYSGDVKVYGQYLNPGAADISERMPGNLWGISAGGQEQVLATYGMAVVELYGSAGQKLNLQNGKFATISMPVQPSQLAKAPSTIPLWYFDTKDGLWKEEGSAKLQNGYYTGAVGHFSFWNCDAGFPLVLLRARFVSQTGAPLVNHWVQAVINKNGLTSGAMTNANGEVAGKVAKGEAMTLRVMDLCGTALYEQVIGPFTDSVNLGTITVTLNNTFIINLSGRLLNCSGQPVSDGFVVISQDKDRYYWEVNNDGTFSAQIYNCTGNPVSIKGVDRANKKETVSVSSPAQSTINFGDITACDNIAEYLQYTIDGTYYFKPYPRIETSGVGTIGTYILDSLSQVYFPGNTVGTYQVSTPQTIWFAPYWRATPNITINVTEYGGSGQFVRGNFFGTLTESPSVVRNVFGDFAVKRK